MAPHIPAPMTIEERRVGAFSVDSVTSSPLQIEVKFRVEVEPRRAFELVFSDISSWFTEVGGIVWDHGKSKNGPNAAGTESTRNCSFGKDALFETIVHYDAPRAYAYRIDMEQSTASFPVKDQLAIFVVEPATNGGSNVTWRQYYRKKFHPLALVINFMLKQKIMRKNIKNLLQQHGGYFL